jgi:transposase
MGRSKILSQHERGKIDGFHELGLSKRDMARRLNRSVSSITNYLNKKDNYGQNHKGKAKKLNEREIRHIVRIARNKQISARNIKNDLHLSVSTSTILRTLRNGNLEFTKMKTAPRLTQLHKNKRLEFCQLNMSRDWRSLWFSDEKKFNLDGPDGFAYYWHDMRCEKKIFSKRQGGGQGVMVWGAISVRRQSKLCFINQRINSESYQQVLENHLLPIYQPGDVFQQDNAPPHASYSTRQWFIDHEIEVLPWPSLSPDLNPIENVWSMLAKAVYKDGKQFESVEELKKSVEKEWKKLSMASVRNLIFSMNNRVFKCIHRHGSCVSK